MLPQSQHFTLLYQLKAKTQDRKAGSKGGWLHRMQGQQHWADDTTVQMVAFSWQLQTLALQGTQKGVGTLEVQVLPQEAATYIQNVPVCSFTVRLITDMRPGPLRSTGRVSSLWKAHLRCHSNQKAAWEKVNRWDYSSWKSVQQRRLSTR